MGVALYIFSNWLLLVFSGSWFVMLTMDPSCEELGFVYGLGYPLSIPFNFILFFADKKKNFYNFSIDI